MKKLFTFLFLFSLTTLAISQDFIVETVGSTGFSPTNLTISVGQTVQWVNTGGNHNVNGTTATYPNNPESFGNAVSSGWTFEHTFLTAGSYDYQCDPHIGLGMVGTVTVMPLPTYTIAEITGDSDMNGETDSVGVSCTLTGVVHGIDMQGGGNIQFTIIDANNDGIGVFSSNDYGYSVNEGDEVTMDGAVASFNGLAQFNPDTIIVNSMGNALSPVADVTDLDESTESQLVRLVDVSLVDPSQWDGSGSNNIDVTDGTSTWTVRIDSDVADVNALAPPSGSFNVTGIGGQFDSSDPYTNGYQLLPRYAADIEVMTTGCEIGILTADSDMNGEADSVGVACTITGIVYGIDMQGNDNIAFTIIDAAGDGIAIFSTNNFGYTVLEGDEITMDGTVASFNGLAQFNPDTIIVNSTGNTIVTPTDVADLNESTESQLVRITNVTLVDPTQWDNSGSNNIDVTDGTTIWTVRIDSDVADLNALPAPISAFNITGIGGQFDSSDPYTEGYQLLPRYAADLEIIPTGAAPLLISGVADPQPTDGSGGNTAGPKMVELYVLEDIADLSIYGVGVANNGGGSDGIEFIFPAVSAAAGDCITYTDSLNAAKFETFFGFPATFLVPSGGVSAAGHNGDDAIELFQNGTVIDVFGDPNVDGTGTNWEYVDGWAYRNFGVTSNGGVFNEDNWVYSGADALQNNTNTMNSEYADPFPTCTYALTPPPPAYPIGLVTSDSDGNGATDSLDVICRLTGVVYGIDLDGNEGLSFTIIDDLGDGINVFNFNDVSDYVVVEGDEITVTGALENYNGLAEIVASDIKLNSSGNTLITPVDVSVLDESTESQFIRMTNWTIVDGSQWLGNGSSFNVDISDGTNTYQMRIDGDTELSTLPIPTGDIFNFTGIGGQFDNMEPWNEGYQIFPRYISDIEGFVSTINPELGNYIKFYPNPTSDVLQIRSDIQLDNIRITNMLGQQVIDLPKPNLSETVNVNNWQTGIYVITFITGNEIWTSQFVKK
ncbi:MAG: plastocyanin/azurin family copper-binding protein [Saprospiraceae bacterium]|nr:plastocyanin/azurin family copper-binding protein [Saprospiraceae bacterium]